MSEHNTHEMPDARPFEERILTRLDSMDARLSLMDSRLDSMETRLGSVDARLLTLEDKVERRLQDTRPMWEAVLARLDGMEKEMRASFRMLGRKINILNRDFLTIRGDIEDLDERVTKLEDSQS